MSEEHREPLPEPAPDAEPTEEEDEPEGEGEPVPGPATRHGWVRFADAASARGTAAT